MLTTYYCLYCGHVKTVLQSRNEPYPIPIRCPLCNNYMTKYLNGNFIKKEEAIMNHEGYKKEVEFEEEPNVQFHANICRELNVLYNIKNHDYGDSFHQTYLEEGMAMPRIRLADKFNRFKSLTRGQKQSVTDESIRDTLIDLANYAIMTVMEMDREKGGDTK